MIELKDVSKTFQHKGKINQALKNIHVKIEEGDIYGVIGFSGAGKSTLVRLVNDLEKPTSGDVLINGQSLKALNEQQLRQLRQRIGMIFQHFNLLDSKTIFHNIAIPLILMKKSKSEIKARVSELLEIVGLSDKAHYYPNELSGGQKQRVGIARALACNPSILLCDEATSALDPQTTKSILNLLKKINRKYKITIMLITHEMSVIQQICNRVAVMENGQIIEEGSVFDVFSRPKHETTKSFVGTVIQREIPKSLASSIQPHLPLYELEMIGEQITQPILSDWIQQYDLSFVQLFSQTTEIQDRPMLKLFFQIEGEKQKMSRAIQTLIDQGLLVKEVTIRCFKQQ